MSKRKPKGKAKRGRRRAAKPPPPLGRVEMTSKLVAELQPADYNPRTITGEALDGLGESMSAFGVVEPIIWNEWSGNVVGGHQRLRILKARGVEATDVVVVRLSPDEEKALNLALNNPQTQGRFSGEVAELIAEIQDALPAVADGLLLDALAEDVGAGAAVKIRPRDVRRPPAMTWALIGIPTVRYGEVAHLVEQVARVEGVRCEVTATNE